MPASCSSASTMRLPCGTSNVPAPSTVSLGISCLDPRNQIVIEGPLQIVGRIEAPVAPRGRVVDVLGPGVDDALPLLVYAIFDARVRERVPHERLNLGRRGVERAQVVRRS